MAVFGFAVMRWTVGVGCAVCAWTAVAADAPVPPLEKPGWRLTFDDEFDRPQLSDINWFAGYRSGRKAWFKRIGFPSRWMDPAANYAIENGILKLRIDEKLPFRTNKTMRCVSSIQTSDHRFGATTNDVQILDKFAQKYGWFEIRCRMPRESGLHSAFWLLQSDPNKQEYTPDGRRRTVGEGLVEIDIFEQWGNKANNGKIDFNVHFTKTGQCEYRMDFDSTKEFHVWALEWREGQLDWYLDGTKIRTYAGATPKERMFILLGLYQGAVPSRAGLTDPDMPYPRDFEIDYVRVYSRE